VHLEAYPSENPSFLKCDADVFVDCVDSNTTWTRMKLVDRGQPGKFPKSHITSGC
jgi:hypothetical protein